LPLVDTEFLFGMRDTDPKHSHVKAILEKLERTAPNKRKELAIPSVALFEIVIVCLSEGKSVGVIVEILRLIEEIISLYKLEVVGFGVEHLVKGLTIYKDLKRGFFDSLMVGSALAHDKVIIGEDAAFLSIPGLARKTFVQYLEELKAR